MKTCLVLAAALLLAAQGPATAPPSPRVIVVPIVGELDAGHMALVRRAAQRIRAEKPELVIFEIDTPGGRIDHMLAMGEEMMALAPVPTAAYIRPLAKDGITGGAWSAGAYLAFSCKRIYMHPGTVIGAAAPVTMEGGEVHPVEEKYVSAFREKFRARAEQNGYPANLAVAMVDKDLEVFEVTIDTKKLFLTTAEMEKLQGEGKKFDWPSSPYDSKDKLLTMTDRQVVDAGMGKIVSGRTELYQDYGFVSPVEEAIDRSWSEDLAGLLTSQPVSFLLLVVGVLGLWVEFKTPGFGVAGVVGILAIGLFLFGHNLVGLAEIPEILLFVVGLALVLVELFVLPGTGIFAIIGVLCIFVGLILSMQSFTIPHPTQAPWEMEVFLSAIGRMLGGFVVASIGFLAVIRFLPKVPFLNRLVLQAAIAGSSPAPAETPGVVGRRGRAITPLHPGGKVEVDGQVYDVVAAGDFVEMGESVEVLQVEGSRMVVGRFRE